MARPVFEIAPLDPNLYTGPQRLLAGVAKNTDVVLDQHFGQFARWLYAGTAGNISYVQWDGTTATCAGLAAGFWHPIFAVQINSAGTTATGLKWGT